MCGFIGKISYDSINVDSIKQNNKRIECRGPDESKILSNKFNQLFSNDDLLNFSFSFNRLAIVDLGKNTSQPMTNKDKHTILMFNGEIFNHRSLRKEMEKDGIIFLSDHSDTEVVLNGLSYYGLNFIDRMIGQFAFIFYLSDEQKLYLVRDRVGQKPLFYARNSSDIIFGSNLISVANEFSIKNIDVNSYEKYLNYGVVPSPATIYENVYKVEPAQIVEFDLKQNSIQEKKYKYWNLKDYESDEKFDHERFTQLISDSIAIREEADVPVANFLSGGIDSSYIIKNMFERGSDVNSFSIVFENENYDERRWSRQVAKKYDTNHVEYEMSTEEFKKNILNSISAYDEPYSDPSTVPTYLISKLMAENYKTAISGDGGDELLGGYKRIQYLLGGARKYKNFYKYFNKIYPNHYGTGNHFLRNSNKLNQATAAYFSDKNLLKYFKIEDNFYYENSIFLKLDTDYKSILYSEYTFYLSEMMMLKVDRASMANSLEVRSPFVDNRLLEYIFKTNPSYIELDKPKNIFKTDLSQDFSNEFLTRPKQGFVFNIEDWVYSNKKLILDTVLENDNLSIYSSNNLSKLFNRKTRINGLRLWKIFLISHFLELNR